MERFWTTAERLVDLYKRYRSPLHARLAWLVVIAGIAFGATPWWMPLLAQVIERYSDLDTKEMLAWAAHADPKYSVVIIIAGLLYHAWSMWHVAQELKSSRVKVVEHDRAIFKELTDIIGEEKLKEFIQRMLGDHSYFDPDMDMLDRAVHHMRLASKRCLDVNLNGAVQVLCQRFDELAHFLGTEFDFYPPTQNFPRGNKYCMRPHWNIDRAGHGNPDEDQKYDQCVTRLHDLCGAAMTQYERVILVAKKQHV